MAAMGIDGLVSGLDTTALINQLMQVEAMPQTLLKSKQSSAQSFVAALQSLNTKVASLADAATKAASPASWQAYTASSSSTSAAVTAQSTAQPGSLTFSVDRVAAAQVSVSDAVPDDGTFIPTIPPAVTVRKADGSFVTVQPTTGSLSDIAKALNDASEAGVKATVVRVTNGGEPTYRIQFTGVATGTDGQFAVFAGTDDSGPRLDTTQVQAAADAQVTLWKGVPGLEHTVTQSSNTFTGLMQGVDVTVSQVTGPDDDPVTVTVGQDAAAVKKLATDLVGALGVVLSEIGSRTATTTSTSPTGQTTVTGGLFTGDSAIRGLHRQISEAVSRPVDGRSPFEAGIVVNKDGTFTLDEEKFSSAMAADPAGVQSLLTQLADRVASVATGASDRYTGSLTLKIQGQEGLVRDMGAQIEGWDRRLELRRTNLQRTYAALEVALSSMQSQSNWLAGQLASLPTASARA